ncbi:hypothetical protein [Serinicoccus kebangsaanensis]|uniref:hypothetical protein n=1 Tax=Serinicoccus kebangsaanensis TaxID=2602069 RepID=UPI00124C0AC4|nr:hypothetical protein [Serinicoccus kebangsaanensis]
MTTFTSTTEPPDPPDGLSDRGRRYWRDVTSRFELAIPHEVTLLHELCRVLGVIDVLADELRKAPSLQMAGSMGQPVGHWALAEMRAQRGQVAQLTKALGLPADDADEQGAEPAIPAATSERARRAANARWAREKGPQ